MNDNSFYSFLVNKNLCTKFENEFFNLMDHCEIIIYFDSKEFSINKSKIFRVYSGFKQEILENITLFNHEQKTSYLNRILERISQSNHNSNESVHKIEVSFFGEEFTPISDFNSYFKVMKRKKNKLINFIQLLIGSSLPVIKNSKNAFQPDSKPIFDADQVTTLINILLHFFSIKHRPLLNQLLMTGDDSSEALIFLGSGNRLADAFKQLYNAGIITGCDKKELEEWIIRNFRFKSHNHLYDFSHYYLNRIISTKSDSCRNPIIDIYKNHDTDKFSIKEIKKIL